jgi:hypothetical protein
LGAVSSGYFFAIKLASSAANTLICAGVMLPAISCGSIASDSVCNLSGF